MKKQLITLVLASVFIQVSLANEATTIQFYCDSESNPTYEYPVDSNGAIAEVNGGHFSEQVFVDEFHLRNGDVKVELKPFHPYCSISIQYVNHTNGVFNSNGNIQFSESATAATSCESEPVQYSKCMIEVH